MLLVRMRGRGVDADAGNVVRLTGSERGTFEEYLARIESLARRGGDGFFVTAVEPDGPRFVQVSAGRGADGTLGYQFDIPLLDWSRAYASQIEGEAQKRGLPSVRSDASPMGFLNIDFATSGDHAVFARWVVRNVFGLPEDTRFEIRWG